MGRLLAGAALLVISAASEESSCAVGESSVLLQRVNRKGRQLPLRQAPQANFDSFSALDLFQSTAELFRSGASPAIIEFTNDTLDALETMVMPELLHGYHEDMHMLEEAADRVHQVLDQLEENRAELHEIQVEEAAAMEEHRQCREVQRTECHGKKECYEGCSQLNQTYITKESEYFQITESVKRHWCVVHGNRSNPVWRTEMQTHFHQYIKLGEERIQSAEALKACVNHCISLARSSGADEVGHECNDKQEQMEHLSCLAEATRLGMNDDFEETWEIETTSFDHVIEYVRPREEIRHHDFKALKAVKCLLMQIVLRAGRPCDETTEPGVANTTIEECQSFWQTDTHPSLNPWNLTYPELPLMPEPLPAELHPCTDQWISEQYGPYSGACFADMLSCWPCHGHGGDNDGGEPDPVNTHDLIQASAQPTPKDLRTPQGANAAEHSAQALVMTKAESANGEAARQQRRKHVKHPAHEPPKHSAHAPPKRRAHEHPTHPALEHPKHPSSQGSPAVVMTNAKNTNGEAVRRQRHRHVKHPAYEPPKHPAYEPPKPSAHEPPRHSAYKPPTRPAHGHPTRPAFEHPRHPPSQGSPAVVMTNVETTKGEAARRQRREHPTRPVYKPSKRPAFEHPKSPDRHWKAPYKHSKPPYRHPSVV